ncbi:MAG: Thiosulfate sulfurtransferase GlpE [Alphaproteobacteria bacterium MarineAlpha6_Bin6]|nr:MAG: Thiosulfate sulfurtransferase GlpE [Alphaproteobacteria bacterium MarineAlpha6_Bin6]PPR33402.1 MAG: Thiosulfate sulfurtransferase GlpE [Alphaproteobacteria bacterium MarineAlpha6_Bin5]|tara:strand:+ start:3394 stop:4278 length:885 start_codon:yes stop_codon:yes gene_type:complete
MINVIGFYKFKKISNLKKLQNSIRNYLAEKLINGTVIIAPEGINGTIAGKKENIEECINYIKKKTNIRKFDSKNFSKIKYQPFNRPKIKIKNEVVPIGLKLTSKEKIKNKYVDPKDWNKLIKKKNIKVIDVRKTMEFRLGTFKYAEDAKIKNFREFPSYFKELNKNKKIAMFCTGGIRCEKAANFLRKKGFQDIYQLEGGILNYLKNIKKKNSLWKGECFVFDKRVTLKHALKPGKYIICSACRTPISPTEIKSKKYTKDISCPYCFDKLTKKRKKKLIIRKKQKKYLKTIKNL